MQVREETEQDHRRPDKRVFNWNLKGMKQDAHSSSLVDRWPTFLLEPISKRPQLLLSRQLPSCFNSSELRYTSLMGSAFDQSLNGEGFFNKIEYFCLPRVFSFLCVNGHLWWSSGFDLASGRGSVATWIGGILDRSSVLEAGDASTGEKTDQMSKLRSVISTLDQASSTSAPSSSQLFFWEMLLEDVVEQWVKKIARNVVCLKRFLYLEE
jgi:hypothetical protein